MTEFLCSCCLCRRQSSPVMQADLVSQIETLYVIAECEERHKIGNLRICLCACLHFSNTQSHTHFDFRTQEECKCHGFICLKHWNTSPGERCLINLTHRPWIMRTISLYIVKKKRQKVLGSFLRQEADKELRRMETTVGEPTDDNRVGSFAPETPCVESFSRHVKFSGLFLPFYRTNSSSICWRARKSHLC